MKSKNHAIYFSRNVTAADILYIQSLNNSDIEEIISALLPKYHIFWYEYFGITTRYCIDCFPWAQLTSLPHRNRTLVIKKKLDLSEIIMCLRGEMYCQRCCIPFFMFE